MESQDHNREDSKQRENTEPSRGLTAKAMARIADIDLPVRVCFGQTRRTLREIIQLGSGALIELEGLADEDVSVEINNKVFARGKVVEVDGYYGVKITSLCTPLSKIAQGDSGE